LTFGAIGQIVIAQGRFMLHGRALAFSILAALTFLAVSAVGQSVISTHSGIVHFFEGAVYLNDQPLESHLGRFSTIPQGGELRTAKGRAEVLLTPGVFIRVGEQSIIRLTANQLSDTRVELLSGSAVVDSAEPASGTSVKLLYKNWSVHFLEQGVYRINSDPPHLWVFQGKAEVSGGGNDGVLLSRGMDVAFAPTLVPSQSPERDHPRDGLSQWADGRRQSISADNTIAANIQDPATLSISTPGVDSFTSFPMLGLPSVGPSGVYSSLGTYQPGFSSIYLPGYTYYPTYTLLPLLIGPSTYVTPHRPVYGGVAPILPSRLPSSSPVGSPIPVRPISPRPVPVRPPAPHPIPVHPAATPGIHPGVHK
jgi:hypothetical protein